MDNFCRKITYIIFPRMSVRMLGKKFTCIIHSSLKNQGVDLRKRVRLVLFCFFSFIGLSFSLTEQLHEVTSKKRKQTNKQKTKTKKAKTKRKLSCKQDLESHARHLPTKSVTNLLNAYETIVTSCTLTGDCLQQSQYSFCLHVSGILKLEYSQLEHFSFLLIGSSLKLSLGKDFKMDDYRTLLFNVSQDVSQISVVLKSDQNAFPRSHT